MNNERRLIVLMQIFKAEFLLPRWEIIKISRCFNEVPELLVYPLCRMMPICAVKSTRRNKKGSGSECVYMDAYNDDKREKKMLSPSCGWNKVIAVSVLSRHQQTSFDVIFGEGLYGRPGMNFG